MNRRCRRTAAGRVSAGLWLAALAVFVAASIGQDMPSASKSLVLKDLLDRTPPEAGEALRDIFRPRQTRPPAGAPEAPGMAAPGSPGSAAAPAVVMPNPDPAVIYIGYVRSERTIIGLVLTGGRTLAVTAGEEIAPGYRVSRITRTQIEVLGPESRVIVYALEGDES